MKIRKCYNKNYRFIKTSNKIKKSKVKKVNIEHNAISKLLHYKIFNEMFPGLAKNGYEILLKIRKTSEQLFKIYYIL